MKPEILTTAQVSELLDVSRMTVLRLIHEKELRAYRVRHHFRVRRDDFEKYMQSADTFGGAA